MKPKEDFAKITFKPYNRNEVYLYGREVRVMAIGLIGLIVLMINFGLNDLLIVPSALFLVGLCFFELKWALDARGRRTIWQKLTIKVDKRTLRDI